MSSCAPSRRPTGSRSPRASRSTARTRRRRRGAPIGHIGVYRFEVRRERIELTLAPVRLARPGARSRDRPRRDHGPRRGHAGVPARAPAPARASGRRRRTPGSSSRRRAPRPRGHGAILRPRRTASTSRCTGATASVSRCPSGSALRRRDRAAEDAIRTRVEAVWEDASPVAFAAAGLLSGIDAAEFAARLLPALEALDDVAVEIQGEAAALPRTHRGPARDGVHSRDHRCGLVRPRRHRHDRRAHDPVRAAVHRPLPRTPEAAAQRRPLLLARAPVAAAPARPHRGGG